MNRNSTIYLIAYDISEDRKRNRMAKLLEQFGYERIQYSVFTGLIPPYKHKELWAKLEKLAAVDQSLGNRLFCFAISRTAFRNMKTIGNFNADIDFILGTKTTEII